jgi:bacillithiol system protein YtxJ
MSNPSLIWKSITSTQEFESIIERSKNKPVLVFKHRLSSPESMSVKADLEDTWAIPTDILDVYIIDVIEHKDVSIAATKMAGVPDEFPQVFLFADGVTMYDESHELISVKKIRIALKIINRTFRWLETRV